MGVLTVSDTSFRDGPSSDRSGPVLRELLESLPSSPYKVINSAIAPDEKVEIRRIVEQWCKEGVDLVLTSGGTGFGVRDCTPEVSGSSEEIPYLILRLSRYRQSPRWSTSQRRGSLPSCSPIPSPSRRSPPSLAQSSEYTSEMELKEPAPSSSLYPAVPKEPRRTSRACSSCCLIRST